jgi:hypothetical protein
VAFLIASRKVTAYIHFITHTNATTIMKLHSVLLLVSLFSPLAPAFSTAECKNVMNSKWQKLCKTGGPKAVRACFQGKFMGPLQQMMAQEGVDKHYLQKAFSCEEYACNPLKAKECGEKLVAQLSKEDKKEGMRKGKKVWSKNRDKISRLCTSVESC